MTKFEAINLCKMAWDRQTDVMSQRMANTGQIEKAFSGEFEIERKNKWAEIKLALGGDA